MTLPSTDLQYPPARPTFEDVYAVGLSFLRQTLRWLGVAEHDIDDVLQEILIAAYRGLDTYAAPGVDAEAQQRTDGGATRTAPPDMPLKRWLFGIAWRQVNHYRERAFRRREVAVGAGATWPFHSIDPSPSSEQVIASEQRGRLIGRVLDKLDLDRRLVLILHDLLDVSLADIAREHSINENTLRNRLRLAREDFRVAVKRMNAEERLALRGTGVLTALERTRGIDPDDLLHAARAIPNVPERLRIEIWGALQHALAQPRRPLGEARPSAPTAA